MSRDCSWLDIEVGVDGRGVNDERDSVSELSLFCGGCNGSSSGTTRVGGGSLSELDKNGSRSKEGSL